MTADEEAAAGRDYAKDAASHPEVTTDGYPESREEAAGITRAKLWIVGSLALVFGLFGGGTLISTYDWWKTRDNPQVSTLTQKEYDVLWQAADPNNRGFNDGAIGAYRAHKYQPVAKSIDRRNDKFYAILVYCPPEQYSYRDCARNLRPVANTPVVYLGLTLELTDSTTTAEFNPMQVVVDLARDKGGIYRCTLVNGIVGEPGTVTFTLPDTVARLTAFQDHDVEHATADSRLSFWSCHGQ